MNLEGIEPPTPLGEEGYAGGRSATVLLVDDQPLIGEAVRRLLAGEEGIVYQCCSDPNAALAMALRVQPSVILQDLVMPEVDGLDLLKQYRANPQLQHVPVIVLSTKEDPAVKKQAFEQGASDYLVKLPHQIELVARIRHHARAHLNRLERDAAMAELERSRKQLLEMNSRLMGMNKQLEDANFMIMRLARQDALTGLANRRVLDEELDKLWDYSTRKNHALSVILMDLDRFKRINDEFGHGVGDVVLRGVAADLISHMRSYDIAARYGGEEFVVLLPESSIEEALEIAERLRASLETARIPGFETPVTASFGVASLKENETAQELMQRADAALYVAKNNGRNRVEAAS